MNRRTFALAVISSAALSACGFELRKAPVFAFKSLYIGGAANSSLVNMLKRNMASNSDVQLFTDPRQLTQADAILDVLGDQRERTVVGLNASGQVRELEIRLRFTFRVRTLAGNELIPSTELLQRRDISYNETIVQAKDQEELLLYTDMEKDIVQQVLRRLAAIKEL